MRTFMFQDVVTVALLAALLFFVSGCGMQTARTDAGTVEPRVTVPATHVEDATSIGDDGYRNCFYNDFDNTYSCRQ